MMQHSGKRKASAGFTLVEIMISLAILGILASISIPNYRLYQEKAKLASVLTTLKYLMDGEDFYYLEHDAFFAVNIQKGKAAEIPELAYAFPDGHPNRYRINVINNKNRNRYIITADCDFDSDGNRKDDRFTATTEISRGEVIQSREIVQLR